MNEIFRYIGYSKQSFHQKMNRKLCEQEHHLLLLPIIRELRAEHPGVAARELYYILQPEGIGRDKFEKLCFSQGLKLQRLKAFTRTTDSTGVIRFPNLIAGREFTGINQAWSSDITYYQINDRFYYLTFIIDLFSRKIVGFSISTRLRTEDTTIPALRKALAERKPPAGLIFHSDGGGQYYSHAFLKITKDAEIRNSMCEVAYENPHAERVNGTIKNQYLKGYNPGDYVSLKRMTKRAVNNYNNVRRHKSLKATPSQFEQSMPAGGCSLVNDDFCTRSNTSQHHQKNNHSTMSPEVSLNKKRVKKTVNVF